MSAFWKLVGVLLLIWIGWDLYAGYTFLYDVIYRATDPELYWVSLAVWFVLAVSCLFSWEGKE